MNTGSALSLGVTFFSGLLFGVLIVGSIYYYRSRKTLSERKTVLGPIRKMVSDSASLLGELENFSTSSNKQSLQILSMLQSLEQARLAATEIQSQAQDTQGKSQDSARAAETGKKSIQEILSFLDHLIENSRKLEEIIKSGQSEFQSILKVVEAIQDKTKGIHDIVFNIKLLSFNASVEAARAGTAGKGFSVVASEIERLARQSGETASAIDQILVASRDQVNSIVERNQVRTSENLEGLRKQIAGGTELGKNSLAMFEEIASTIEAVGSKSVQVLETCTSQAQTFAHVDAVAKDLDGLAGGISAQALKTLSLATDLVSDSSGLQSVTRKSDQSIKLARQQVRIGKGETIRFGTSLALSGGISALGSGMLEGLRLGFTEANAQGGVEGRPVELIALDDQYNPEIALENTRTLIEKKKVFALVGYLGSATTLVSLPLIEKAQLSLIGPCTGSERLRSPFRSEIFNVRASYFKEVQAIVDDIVLRQRLTKIAALLQADAYGSTGELALFEALKKHKLTLFGKGCYERGTTEVELACEHLATLKPQAVVVVGTYKASAAFVRRCREKGFNPVFLNLSFVGADPFLQEIGKDGESVYFSQVVPPPDSSDTAIVSQFRKAASAAGLRALQFSSLEGYMIAQVALHALRVAGVQLNRESFSRALETVRPDFVRDFNYDVNSESHRGSQRVWLTQVKNGRFVEIASS